MSVNIILSQRSEGRILMVVGGCGRSWLHWSMKRSKRHCRWMEGSLRPCIRMAVAPT